MSSCAVDEVGSGRPKTPAVAADIIIEIGSEIVLIERRNPPPGWAIPGGFVDPGETVESAALREAAEETGLEVTLRCLLGCYSDPRRDPRGHTVSLVYVGSAQGTPEARDDAAAVRLVDPARITLPLAFDHEHIIADYLVWRDSGCSPGWRPGAEFLAGGHPGDVRT
ncbi:MAG: NUDIX hydrolase [Gammaproteobacteria bacterium]|jgi:8-oxo-dGTP diphosphatase|nr:NUDIX hydrolase [Gammaproteobacteria bacterium]